eukprot:scaffold81625_cov72-Attheya_sp.AAC.2
MILTVTLFVCEYVVYGIAAQDKAGGGESGITDRALVLEHCSDNIESVLASSAWLGSELVHDSLDFNDIV